MLFFGVVVLESRGLIGRVLFLFVLYIEVLYKFFFGKKDFIVYKIV